MTNTSLYDQRLQRVQDAIHLKEPDCIPIIPKVAGTPYYLYHDGGSHASENYGYNKAIEAYIRYHAEFQPDVRTMPDIMSGLANEIAGTTMLDWPGRPGTAVQDLSTYQVIENEYMAQDEYEELIQDYTGFLFRKYIPRAYPGLKGFAHFVINPAVILGTKPFSPMFNDQVKLAMTNFIQMINESANANEFLSYANDKLDEMGFPPYNTGGGEVPYDIVSDYFRGTMGIFDDLVEIPEMIAKACKLFTDIQIKNLSYFENSLMKVKRVFFPLHKGMDGFMSPRQYDELYWSPYQELLKYLIQIDVTPIIYCEGPYNSRLDYIRGRLSELPKGSCIVHFETGDFAKIKKLFSGIACLSGGMPLYLLEYGSKLEVVERTKYLIDNCGAGGGFLLNSSGAIENVKRENFEAMFETARTYGKK